MTPIFLTVKEFAKISGIGINRAYELTRISGFPSVKEGRKIQIHNEKAVKWLSDYVDNELHSRN